MKESFSKMFEQQMEENPGALKKARKEKRNREFDRGYPDEETMWAEQDSYNIMRSVLTRVDLYVRTLEDIALREIEIISQEAKEHSIQVGKSTSWKMERLMKKWAKITETEHRGIIQEEEDTEKGLHIHPVPLSENFIENFLFISDTSYNERDEQELNKVYFAIHT